jgi:diguanylate cyclase (GGDEF)-like protein/PAS domain S-box-containing protein
MAHDSGILNLLVLTAHEALNEGVVMGDGDRILHVNDAVCRFYGRSREDLLARGSLFQFLVPEERERIEGIVRAAMDAGEPVPQRFETMIARPDGSVAEVEISTTALVDGGATRTLTLIRDISERTRQRVELERLALHDALTGLPNRRLLMERLERIAARAERDPVSGALFFLDLDGLKRVNDTHGHDAGDRVLVGVAEALRAGLRSCDSAARLGGDEFVVICERIDDDAQADRLSARLRTMVAQPVEVAPGQSVTVDVSVGIERFGGERIDPEALLAGADEAMYRAKAARRRS